MNEGSRATFVTLLMAALASVVFDCGCATVSMREEAGMTEQAMEALRDTEILLPMLPDSIIAIYSRYDQRDFHQRYRTRVDGIILLMDSLNSCMQAEHRFGTLNVDHSFENFGQAGRSGSTLVISSSYVLMYDDPRVLRSVVFHEYGHAAYDALPDTVKRETEILWDALKHASMLYLLTDGEYSSNARFGGHPYDSPAELFASTFNLFHNNIEELDARLQYIEGPRYRDLRRLFEIVSGVDGR